MYPKIFNLINTYPVCIIIGIFFSYYILNKFANKNNIDKNFYNYFLNTAITAVVVGFISAMLFQSFYDYLEDPSEGFKFKTDMTFYGGLIGGLIFFFSSYILYGKKKYGAHLISYLPILVPVITLSHGWGRIGCFMAGCCYGAKTDSIFGVQFPNLWYKVYPTQLFEALFLFIIFGITLYLAFKKNYNYNFTIYFITYSIFRFSIEFIRGDHRGSLVSGISPSQFWSIILFILGIASLFLIKHKERVGSFITNTINFFLGNEMFRFLIAGGINTLMGGILIPFIFSKIINIDFIVDIPLVLGYLCWFTFAYFIQIKFVFNSTFEWKRFWAYPLSQIPNLLLNLGFKYLFSLFIKSSLLTYFLAALFPIPIMFFIVRFIVKNNDKQISKEN